MQKLPNADDLFAGIAVWEHLCMKSEDDPEARIRELEKPLADTARASEAGGTLPPGKWAAPPTPAFPPPAYPQGPATPPPAYPRGPAIPPTAPPPLDYGTSSLGTSTPWTAPRAFPSFRLWLILASVLLPVVIGIVGVILVNNAGHQISRGLSTLPSVPSFFPNSPTSNVTQAPTQVPIPSPPAPPTAPAGDNLTISGINESQTITCNANAVNVSGISNKVVIKGVCNSLHVSGVQNVITIDAVGSIEVSGFSNQVTYHTGTPSVDKSGDGNVVQQG
jgi:hypothetical protein